MSETTENLKKLEFKNLIKDRVLKPSKLPKYDSVRGHHAHLVIRDSHYLIKEPTSFITCSSCHRGRVLKIATIKELTTQQILNEIYSTIGKNPCQKRKNTAREKQILPEHQQVESQSHVQPFPSLNTVTAMVPTPYQPSYHPLTSVSYPLPPSSGLTHSLPQSQAIGEIPSFEDLFTDFEPLQNLPQFCETINVSSIGAAMKVTSFTLISLFHGHSNFPANLDFLLSLAVQGNFGFFTHDTLIVPLPVQACTMFVKDPLTNVRFFRSNEGLLTTLNNRIHEFVQQKDFDLANLKVVIYFNYFQESFPERANEPNFNKYVGNMYIISGFRALSDSRLTFSSLRYAYNYGHSVVDNNEEIAKNGLFYELILSRLQNEVFLKTNEAGLGTHISPLELEKPAHITMIPYTCEESQVGYLTRSLFIVCYISLKLLRVAMSDDSLHSLACLSTVQYNSKFHIYLLKLLLEHLRSQEKSFRPLHF
jgi:hypothetical protein